MNEKRHSRLVKIVALLCALLLIIIGLAGATTHFYYLGYGFVWVFGLTGLYAMVPISFVLLLTIFILGKKPSWLCSSISAIPAAAPKFPSI